MMKRITIVSDFYLPHWTGISKSVAYTVEALHDDFLLSIITVQFDKKLALEENKNKLKIIRCPVFFSLSRAQFSLALIINFFKNISQTDIVLINSPSIHILPIALISKIFNKKLLIFHHGDLILPVGIVNFFIEKIFNLSTLIAFSFAHQLATYTNDYAINSRLLSKFPKKTQNFILPLPYFCQEKKEKNIDLKIKKKLLKIKKDKKILIGFAGRFVEEKGFDVLLKAGIELKKQRNDFFFVFAGEKNITYEKTYETNQKLIKQLEDEIIFLGLLDDEQLLEFYQAIDLFVLPSRSECFGLVQAEAMAEQTPVLVANIPGARDPVKKTSFGLLFDANNAEDLLKKINTMLNKLPSYNQQYQKVLNYFNYEKSRKNLIRFIQNQN